MDGWKAIVRWIIFLSAAVVVSIALLVRAPGAAERFGPLVLFLFLLPVGVVAWRFGATAAFWAAVINLLFAAITLCAPQYFFVRAHSAVDIQASDHLREVLEISIEDPLARSLEYHLDEGGTLEHLLDRKVSYRLLSTLWPFDKNFGKPFWAYLTRPLISTGMIWQILMLLVIAPFMGVLAEGGLGQRRRLIRFRDRVRVLEEDIKKTQASQTLGREEAADEANYLQSMIITISDMAREVSAALHEETIFKLVLKKTAELVRARKVALFRPDGTGEQLVWVGSHGYDAAKTRALRIDISEEGGIVGWCAKNRLFLSMDEVREDYHRADLADNNKLETLYCQPVVRSGELILVICVGETERKLSHKSVARIMSTLANFVAIALDNARLLEKTRQQAIRDGLTGLYNHRYFQEHFDRVLQKARARGQMVACILIDLDHFKRLNDAYGHQAGDEVLRRVAKVLQEMVVAEGFVARYGGEEFVIVLTGKNISQAQELAERIRHQVEETRVETPEHNLRVTLSLGLSGFDPHKEMTTKDLLIRRADQALYQAKEAGRNRVAVHGSKQQGRLARGA